MTAAHKTLPFGTVVKVTDQRTKRTVTVRINAWGPYHGGRIIDLIRSDRLKGDLKQAGRHVPDLTARTSVNARAPLIWRPRYSILIDSSMRLFV